jgi:L-seryl-tRNA(Ser) seleniumtransferase
VVPYEGGRLLATTDDHLRKLRHAWGIVERREADGTLVDLTGLERSFPLDAGTGPLDDEIAAATYSTRLRKLALEHLGGREGEHDAFLANRLTAGIVASMQVLVERGGTVVALSPTYTHPAVVRAVELAGGTLVDTSDVADFEGRLAAGARVAIVTRLAVTYDALTSEDLARAVAAAREHRAVVFVDDAGGARVGPAVLEQPRTLELGDVGATGLDKYGTSGPRLGLVGGRAEVVARIRSR